MARKQDLPKLKKRQDQWVQNGERITLSAEWEVEDIDGLLISKRRVEDSRERTRGQRGWGPAAWRVHARKAEPEMRDIQTKVVIIEAVPQASRQAEKIAEQLKGKWFETREEALWAVTFTQEELKPS